MAAKDEIQSSVFRSAGGALWAVIAFVLVVGGGLAAWFVFGDEIQSGYDFANQQETNTIDIQSNRNQLNERGPVILRLERSNETLIADLNRITDRVNTLEEQEGGLAEITRNSLTSFTSRLAVVEDNVGDLQGQVDRVDAAAGRNTDWRDEQEKRAATRVAEQGFREDRLRELESIIREIETQTLPEIKQEIALLKANP